MKSSKTIEAVHTDNQINEELNKSHVGADASVRPEHKWNTQKWITLLALIITTIFSYDENVKSSNNKGFLLQTI
mgnify:FL=1